MKRCPKCSRTFPDDNQKFCTIDGGLLVAGDKPFDPNATIQSKSAPSAPTPPPPPAKEKEPDFGATIATSSSAPTAVLPKKTGPTGSVTAANLSQQPPQQPPPPAAPPVFAPTAALPSTPGASLPPTPSKPLPPAPKTSVVVAAAPPKKSKLPLILGILAILLILGVGAVVAAFFLVIKPRLDLAKGEPPVVIKPTPENVSTPANTPANTPETPEFVAPPDSTKFTNSQANLDGKLAEHYLDFSFYYPNSWEADRKAGVPGASNFAKVERRLPPDFTQENFAVGWYTSKGTFADDEATFPQLVEGLSANLAKNFPEYRKVSEGPTKVNSIDGYEFRFESISKGSEKGDIHLWGRVIFLPTGVAGDSAGATLVMLATSLAPELTGVDDVGVKGEMPVILESFRFGKK
ncbi:MAG TPA: hypothetical protein VGN90_09455 [Pyrinomonadaceae bacterium]|nr:hypothetical protein [Pyrinomonadaceae bacterium]